MQHDGIGNLGAELQRILEAAEKLLGEGAESVGEGIDAAGGTARESLQRACGHLRSAHEELTSRARRVDGVVRNHPWESVAVVGVAAFLLGTLVRRR